MCRHKFTLAGLIIFCLVLSSCVTTTASVSSDKDEKTGLMVQTVSYELWDRQSQREGVLHLHRRQTENGVALGFFFSFLNTEWMGYFDTLVVVLDGVEHVFIDPTPVHLVQEQEVEMPTRNTGRSLSFGVSSGGNVRVGASTTVNHNTVHTTTTVVTVFKEELRVAVSAELLYSILNAEKIAWVLRSNTKQQEMVVGALGRQTTQRMLDRVYSLLYTEE